MPRPYPATRSAATAARLASPEHACIGTTGCGCRPRTTQSPGICRCRNERTAGEAMPRPYPATPRVAHRREA